MSMKGPCEMPDQRPLQRSLSRDEVREIDRRAIDQFGMSGLVLMENAGRGCADVLCRLGCDGKIVIVCGRGNNAGDGFVIARHLELRGADVRVVLLGNPRSLRGDAAANFNILRSSGLPMAELFDDFEPAALMREIAGAQWIVDAMLGTGAAGSPRAPWDSVIEILNDLPAQRLAVDLPTGLDCDTGLPCPTTFRAHCTCTFVAPKLGFALAAARPYLGMVEVIDIGVPRKLLLEFAESKAG
jgi:NAD(P)H-hydrate epimerase